MTQTQIMERAAAVGYPTFIAGGSSYRGEAGWRQFAVLGTYHAILAAQLDEAEARRDRQTAVDTAEDMAARDRESALSEDPEAIEEHRQAARAEHDEYVRRRPERTEKLLERIATAVEALAKR